MSSSPQHGQPETVQEESILLERVSFKVTLKQFCDNFTFLLVTILIVLDLVTDVWTLIQFGQRRRAVFACVMAVLFVLGSLAVAIAHCSGHRSDTERRIPNAYLNLCLNFPLQLGILYQRLAYSFDRCHHCCPKQIAAGHAHAHGPRGKPSNADWKYARLKLLQSMFQCTPQLMGNLLYMLLYKEAAVIQIVSAALSFVSLVLGVVIHEKARKEQSRGTLIGLAKVLCILLYKTLVIGTRIVAIVHFMYYFGGWTAAMFVPHVGIMLAFYLYLYRQIWKVQYHTIVEHSLYSVLAYFPIHSEYRPEGEIVVFYILFMVENIIMVALPFKVTPTMTISRPFHPTSRYYFIVMLLVLVGATAGLIFMTMYYFLFHKSRHSIRDTHLGWLACLCEWRRAEQEAITVTVSNAQNPARSGSGLQDLVSSGAVPIVRDRQGGGDDDVVCHTPHEHDDGSGLVRHVTDVDASLLNANVVKFVTSTPNPESGSQHERLLIQSDVHQETDNRPSVLEGDDEDDDDQTHIVV